MVRYAILYALTPWLLGWECPVAASDAAVNCRITSARPARVFYPGETPFLNIQANVAPQDVSWEVRDHSDQVVASGQVRMSSEHPATLQFPNLTNGLYRVSLLFTEGRVQDAFCVIPPPDECARDGALWGFQMQWGFTDDLLAAMAQAGVRFLRFDLSWPDHEREKGRYNSVKADQAATLLKRWGLQMIPTLGYTPAWTGARPDNYPVRSHTWNPDSVEDWVGFIQLMRDRLAQQTVSWPSREVVPDGMRRQSYTMPLVRYWEIWNEADQNYYSGTWGRYVDLLKVASRTLKSYNFQEQIAYGGSCAHWTEMGKTCAFGGLPYFDVIAWHSNSDIETALPAYTYGSPQLTYANWLPRQTIQTECYPVTKPGVSEAEYVLRLFTVLRAWRQEAYCYSAIGGHLVGRADPNSISMLYTTPHGQYVPNAKYVAYAVTRWLLDSAAYLGPLSLGGGVTAHLFARQGRPLLIAWADGGAQISVDLGSDAARVDIMGRRHPLQPGPCSLTLTGAPTAILGVDNSYVPTAMRAYFERWLATEYGFEYPVDSPYLRPLEVDSWATASRIRPHFVSGLAALCVDGGFNVTALERAAQEFVPAVAEMVTASARIGRVHREHITSTWRLQLLAEWLAEACDALAASGGPVTPSQPRGTAARQSTLGETTPQGSQMVNLANLTATARNTGVSLGTFQIPGLSAQGSQTNPNGTTASQLWTQLALARARVEDRARGIVYPFPEALLMRGFRMAGFHTLSGGRGSYLAATTACQSAVEWLRLAPRVVNGVLLVGHFPTANHMKKALLFRPGQTHRLEAQVYNFTARPVSGTVTWSLPGTWSPTNVSLSFTAPANGYTPRIPCHVTIPGDPEPWVIKTCYTPGGNWNVLIPASLETGVRLTLSGVLSDGRVLQSIPYEAWVGIWQP